jgi:hypothetical protein
MCGYGCGWVAGGAEVHPWLLNLACRQASRSAACCWCAQRTHGSLAGHCHTEGQPLTASPRRCTACTACTTCTAERVMKYNYDDTEVVHRVFGSACYITDSFPRWVGRCNWVSGLVACVVHNKTCPSW